MNLDIRSHIINNFKGDDINTLKDAINDNETVTLNGNLKRQLQVAMYGLTEDHNAKLKATPISKIEATSQTNYYDYLSTTTNRFNIEYRSNNSDNQLNKKDIKNKTIK